MSPGHCNALGRTNVIGRAMAKCAAPLAWLAMASPWSVVLTVISVICTLAGTTIDVSAKQNASEQKLTSTRKMGVKVSYKPVSFADLPGWDEDDHLAALRTFQRSCLKLVETARNGGKSGPMATPVALLGICDEAILTFALPVGGGGMRKSSSKGTAKKPGRSQARAFFEQYFTPYRMQHNGPRSVLTGYYEPVLQGSRRRHGKFQTPIYKRPADLVNLVGEADRASVGNAMTHARRTDKGLEPYATRAEIEQGALDGKGLELLYLAEPVDAFFLHIQGSGRIKLEDGSSIRITYDGKNGYPYSSIGHYLIRIGVMGAKSMSLQALRKWLMADRERGRKVMWHNQSFIFFRELKGAEASGARGVMDVQLTPGRSLAVDPRYHVLGLPIYVSAPGLRHVKKGHGFHRLMVGQDVGSAIKGPERGDIYFGSGKRAGELAGVTKATGTFFVLLPKLDWSAEVTNEVAGKPSTKSRRQGK